MTCRKGNLITAMTADTPADTAKAASATAARQGSHTHRAPAASTAGNETCQGAELDRLAHRQRTEVGTRVRRNGMTTGLTAADDPRVRHTADTAADKPVGIVKAAAAARS